MSDLDHQRQSQSLDSSANSEIIVDNGPLELILAETSNLTKDVLDIETNKIQLERFTIQSSSGTIKVTFEGNYDIDNPISSVNVVMQDGTVIKSTFQDISFSKSHISKVLDFIVQAANKYQNLNNLKEFLSKVMQASIDFMF